MKVVIALPLYFDVPIGGYKVAFEYANRLHRRGHEVSVVLPHRPIPHGRLKSALKSWLWAGRLLLRGRLIGWFDFDPGVRLRLPPDLHPRFAEDADAIIATHWSTAEAISAYPPGKGRKFYLIYDYEFWRSADETTRGRMEATYADAFTMIATSPSVIEMLATVGATPTAYIPCGLDFENFGVASPIENRTPSSIGFAARPEPFKGCGDAIAAAARLREKYGPRLTVTAFGWTRPDDLPDWIRFLHRPDGAQLRRFYNDISIFLQPSHYEGWGLPGMEALACGAALVTADSVGMRDYARDGETALVVPRERADLLAEAIDRLITDDALRARLARQGHAHVQRYTWDAAVDAMERSLAGAA